MLEPGNSPNSANSFLSQTVQDLSPSGIRKFFDLTACTEGVISLGVGEPDYITPEPIRNACRQALLQGHTKYTSNHGLPELREEIAQYLSARYDLNYHPDQILITTGVSEAADLVLRAIINPGDQILIGEPCYVSYVPNALIAGGVPVPVPTSQENGFRLRKKDLLAHITDRTKAILLSYPNNPTGAIMTRQDLEEVAQVAREYNLLVITDEVYSELTYDARHVSIVTLPGMQERTIFLNGFSKTYAMTGWRLGYAAGPVEIIDAMLKIHQYTMLCAPTLSQYVAITALRQGSEFVTEMVNEYNIRRRLFVDGLRQLGLPCFEPEGAFYAFPCIKDTGMSSEEFSEGLLLEEKVAVVPGNAFGSCGEGFIRCCYATGRSDLEEALERMDRYLKRHRLSRQAIL